MQKIYHGESVTDVRKATVMMCFVYLSFLCVLCAFAVKAFFRGSSLYMTYPSVPVLLHALQAVIRQPGCSRTGIVADHSG
jgi:hypothetical protein